MQHLHVTSPSSGNPAKGRSDTQSRESGADKSPLTVLKTAQLDAARSGLTAQNSRYAF